MFIRPAITAFAKKRLEEIFRDRVRFDWVECLLYSHDLGTPPKLMRSLVGGHAEGVVQPLNESEISELIQVAVEHRIPLTPRGKGTSGYGGAIPVKGGLVVDFSKMNRVLKIEPTALLATVEPGVVWLDLEKALASHGLTLRIYPGSAPVSTVGGWLAQGGTGFGSYAHGWFRDNVVSVRLIRGDGRAVDCMGDELDAVFDAGGITGFVTQITLLVKPFEEMTILAASFASAKALGLMLESVVNEQLKLWSVSFTNPHMNSLADLLADRQDGLGEEDSNSYLATFVFPKIDSAAAQKLEALVHASNGRMLAQEKSQGVWDDRFNILKIKKLAPSLISTKAAIPLESLKTILLRTQGAKHPLAIDGLLLWGGNNPQAVLLGFIVHDERKLSYNLIYGLALSFLRLAISLGGRPCGTGAFFKSKAELVLGADRLKRLRTFKPLADPQGILNPGKVLGRTDLLDVFMNLAWSTEPIVRFVANRLPLHPPKTNSELKETHGDLRWDAYSCDQCGYCLQMCHSFNGWESQSHRGRWYLFREVLRGNVDYREVKEHFAPCKNCEYCTASCPQGLPWLLPQLVNKCLTS